MAPTLTNKPEFPAIDPLGPSGVEDIAVDLDDFSLDGADLSHVSAIYDRPSDILIVLRRGRDRPYVAAGGRDNIFMLIDPDTNEVVGMQVEDFITRMVPEQPRLFEALEFAELHGMTREDVLQIRRQALSPGDRLRAWLRRTLHRTNAANVSEQGLQEFVRSVSWRASAPTAS